MLSKSQGGSHKRQIPQLIHSTQVQIHSSGGIAQNTMMQVRVTHTANQAPRLRLPIVPCDGDDTQKMSSCLDHNSPQTSTHHKIWFASHVAHRHINFGQTSCRWQPLLTSKGKGKPQSMSDYKSPGEMFFSVTVLFGFCWQAAARLSLLPSLLL